MGGRRLNPDAVDARMGPVRTVSGLLHEAGIEHALGGSGLMRLLGIDVPVRDWDLTTDASRTEVARALGDLRRELLPQAPPCRSDFLLSCTLDDETIEIMGGFRLDAPTGEVLVRTRVTAHAHGVPLGCPAEWARAYRLMGREEKARLLEALSRRDGAPI